MPFSFDDSNGVVVSLIGGVFAGKSAYIRSLGYQFRTPNAKLGSIAVEYEYREKLDPYVRQIRDGNNYSSPSSTQVALEGVKHNRLYHVWGFSKPDSKVTYVTLFDHPGDAFHGPYFEKHFGHLLDADAVILMVDPLMFETEWWSGLDRKAYQGDDAYVERTWTNRVIQYYRQEHNLLRHDQLLPLKCLVALSKCDVMKRVTDINQEDFVLFTEDGSIVLDDPFDSDAFRLRGQSIKRAMGALDGGRLVGQLEREFSQLDVCAIAAQGSEDTGNDPTRYHPIRVFEPIRWALWATGFLQEKVSDPPANARKKGLERLFDRLLGISSVSSPRSSS